MTDLKIPSTLSPNGLRTGVSAILGDPEIDPHGHVIPQKHALGVYRNEVPLAQWPLRTPALVTSVSDRSSNALRELERLGLGPGTEVIVEKKNSASSLSIRIDKGTESVRLNNELAHLIFVCAVTSEA